TSWCSCSVLRLGRRAWAAVLVTFWAGSAGLPLPHAFPTRRSSDLNAFVIGRSLMRGALGRLLHRPAAEVPLVMGPHGRWSRRPRSEEHTSELQSREKLVCRLLLEKINDSQDTGETIRLQEREQPLD